MACAGIRSEFAQQQVLWRSRCVVYSFGSNSRQESVMFSNVSRTVQLTEAKIKEVESNEEAAIDCSLSGADSFLTKFVIFSLVSYSKLWNEMLI